MMDELTVRDYFAAKAMQGFLSSGRFDSWAMRLKGCAEVERIIASASYDFADALLKARKS